MAEVSGETAAALEELKSLCAWEEEPALSEPELLRCLTRNQHYIPYPLAGETVVTGAVVCPTGSTRQYVCVSGGVIDGALAGMGTTRLGRNVSDGTATWQDDGPAYPTPYDLQGAARAAWELKASKDAALINVKDKDTTIDLVARREFALEMAGRYQKVWI